MNRVAAQRGLFSPSCGNDETRALSVASIQEVTGGRGTLPRYMVSNESRSTWV
jgi:hypothetical protein